MFIVEILAVCGFVVIADRIVYRVWRRTRFEKARSEAAYPLSDPTNFRQPSLH